ncbi:conserved exported hypothetical protein [Candidatus Desulfosporosinus infrequens]|uniref:DUF7948 domain-containing protein n=1 Tax=Candidatus Desulfosporosinus infrequens TaxID=2043169 RepID=A0A2U3KUX3_9FIRM|nr:conserved exported hypothetical protein [Candidatus Desulfosporosinus infrequens]
MRLKTYIINLFTTILFCSAFLLGIVAQSGTAVAGTTGSITPEQKAKIASVQVPFVANEGQVANDQVKFYAQTFAGTVFVTNDNIGYALPKDNDSGCTVNESFVGGNVLMPAAVGSPVAPVNYYIGEQQKSLLSYNEITLGEVYNDINVNLKAYGDNVEKIFTVNPGGDPASIKLQVNGANSLNVDAQGELELTTGLGTVKITKPVAYQIIDGQQVNVDVAYAVKDENYGFKLGTYNPSYSLVIDPLLASTYLGGSGSDVIKAMAFDAAGNVYVTGTTTSMNFPTVTGCWSQTYAGGSGPDAFVAKLSGDLTQLLAATYLGGSSYDYADAITLDGLGNLYITGYTRSGNFPVTTSSSYTSLNKNGTYAVFVSELDCTHLNLGASTCFGGTALDRSYAICLDPSGNVFVAGATTSTNLSVTGYQKQLNKTNGGSSGLVLKFSSNLSQVLASTYLGGNLIYNGQGGSVDTLYAMSIDKNGNVYVGGGTSSKDYPTTTNAFETVYSKTSVLNQGIVSELSNDLSQLTSSSYLGGTTGATNVRAITFDPSGNVCVTGDTQETDFPVTTGTYQQAFVVDPTQTTTNGFVTKLKSNLSGPPVASTYIGGIGDTPYDIASDISGNIFITGETSSPNYPTTTGSFESTDPGPTAISNPYVSKLSGDLSNLLASTYLGGSNGDSAYKLRISSEGNIYVVGQSNSTDSPVVSNAYQGQLGTGASSNGFITELTSDLALAASASPTLSSAATSTTGSSIVLTMSAALTGTTGAPTAFTISGVASNPTVTNVTVSGTSVTLTLSAAVVSTDSPKISYNPTGTNDLTNGTAVVAFTNQAVVNNVAAAAAPTLSSAATSTTGSSIVLTMSSALTGTTGAPAAFAISGVASNPTVNSVTVSGTSVTLALSAPVVSTDTPKISYNPTGTNDLTNGTKVAAFTSQTVTNNVASSGTYAVSGTITDATSGAAISGATVSAGSGNQTNTDTNGTYTLNLPTGDYTLTVSKTGYQTGTISGTIKSAALSNQNLTLSTAASSDASLATVAGQVITAGGQAGTIAAPKLASINVANGIATVAAADVVKNDAGATVAYYGTDSTFTTTTSAVINLTVGTPTVIYIKVTAADTTALYYAVTINRAAAVSAATATPTITGTPTAGDTSVSGTAVAEASVVLTMGGTAQPAVTADASGNWTVTGLTLVSGNTISVTALATGDTISNAATVTVQASSSTPWKYTVTPIASSAYTNAKTTDGIDTMTVNSGSSGLVYFTADIAPVLPITTHTGGEKVVFVQLRNNAQINLNATGADFNTVNSATAGFNVQVGDVIKVYIVDDLTNATNFNPTVLE